MKVPVQPEVNIGVVGHVDHGKTTLTQLLTGESTDRHSEEIRRGISIRLGYADTAFYRCPGQPEPQCFQVAEACPDGGKAELLRAVSFVDSPGHETLMATMLSGAAIMDGALLVIAANEKCPQPQTKEHLMALGIIGVERVVVVQNKIDLVDEKQAAKNYQEIEDFIKGSVAEGAPIIPVSAHHNINIDYLIMEIERVIPTKPHDLAKPARMYVARSFDVNNPGIPPEKLVGGVIGGTLIQGTLRVGDEIEIRPGLKVEGSRETVWQNLLTEVTSLRSGGLPREEVKPGGLIAIGTQLDPTLTKSDSMVGRVVGKPGTLPDVLQKFTLDVNLLERVVGTEEELKVEDVKTNEALMLSIGTAITVGVVTSARANVADVALKAPVSADAGQRVAIGRRIGGKYRLIGYGIIK